MLAFLNNAEIALVINIAAGKIEIFGCDFFIARKQPEV